MLFLSTTFLLLFVIAIAVVVPLLLERGVRCNSASVLGAGQQAVCRPPPGREAVVRFDRGDASAVGVYRFEGEPSVTSDFVREQSRSSKSLEPKSWMSEAFLLVHGSHVLFDVSVLSGPDCNFYVLTPGNYTRLEKRLPFVSEYGSAGASITSGFFAEYDGEFYFVTFNPDDSELSYVDTSFELALRHYATEDFEETCKSDEGECVFNKTTNATWIIAETLNLGDSSLYMGSRLPCAFFPLCSLGNHSKSVERFGTRFGIVAAVIVVPAALLLFMVGWSLYYCDKQAKQAKQPPETATPMATTAITTTEHPDGVPPADRMPASAPPAYLYGEPSVPPPPYVEEKNHA